MKKIEPYSSVQDALKSLDNGGRFFNIFTHEDDGMIGSAEIEKVAGLFGNEQKAMIYLDLALSGLDEAGRNEVISHLKEKALKAYQKYKPVLLNPSEANATNHKNMSVCFKGIAKPLSPASGLKAVVLIPVMAGPVMTLIPIPMVEQYDVYEMQTEAEPGSFLIAHEKGQPHLPATPITAGTIIKEMNLTHADKEKYREFGEVIFYHDRS